MAVMTDLFKRMLDGQVVRYVSILNLDDIFKKEKPKEKRFIGGGRIKHEITDDKITLTMEHGVPEKETIVIQLTDDLSFGLRPIGEVYKLPTDAPCFRMELFNETSKLATTLDFADADYVDEAL
jgi:hypothetical protein